MRENNYQCNVALNKEVSIDKIEKVISKLKNNKSVGNQVTNEVIKCNTYRYLLFELVQFCFSNSLVPTIWRQAIIKPIPKGATKDPFDLYPWTIEALVWFHVLQSPIQAL